MISIPNSEAAIVEVTPSLLETCTMMVEAHSCQFESDASKNKHPLLVIFDSSGCLVKTMSSWLINLRNQIGLRYASSTVRQYGKTLLYLCRWIEIEKPYSSLDPDGNIRLLTRANLTKWLSAMQNSGLGGHSLRTRETCVKQFFDWLCTEEGGNIREEEKSPWGRDETLGYISCNSSPLSPKFIAANLIIELLKGFHNECERVMYHTQYDMGLRIGELVDLRISDLPREEHYDPACEFLPVCIRGNKGRAGRVKQRTTVISRAVLNRIRRYHNSLAYKLAENWQLNDINKPVFLTPNGKAWSVRNASQQFKRSARRQRLDPKICTHWLRHGTAFSILRSDIGKSYEDRMLTVQQLLGHSRLSTTEIYTQISPAMLLSLTERGREINRLTEAEEIREATFLGSNQHCEKRGHHV